MSLQNRAKHRKLIDIHIVNIAIIDLVLDLLVCGACTPEESIAITKYTGEQIIELAQKHSPDCYIRIQGESTSP